MSLFPIRSQEAAYDSGKYEEGRVRVRTTNDFMVGRTFRRPEPCRAHPARSRPEQSPTSREAEEPRSRGAEPDMQTCKHVNNPNNINSANKLMLSSLKHFHLHFYFHHLVLFNNPNPPKLDPQSLHLQSSQQDLPCDSLSLPRPSGRCTSYPFCLALGRHNFQSPYTSSGSNEL